MSVRRLRTGLLLHYNKNEYICFASWTLFGADLRLILMIKTAFLVDDVWNILTLDLSLALPRRMRSVR